MDLTRLISMGAYTSYVWSAYVITATGLIAIVWSAQRQLKEQIAEARRRRQTRE